MAKQKKIELPAAPALIGIEKPEGAGTIKITDEEKEQFFKSFLSDKPFEETVSLFGGKQTLKFRYLTLQQNDDILKQINKDKDNGVADNTDAYFIRLSCYRFLLALVEVDKEPFLPDINEDTDTDEKITYVGLRADAVKDWSAYKVSAYLDVFNLFEKKVLELAKQVLDENFWKAAV